MIIEVVKNKECCGCLLCVTVCPVDAIKISHRDGFEFPQVNQDKCIGCSKCVNVCPVHNSENIKKTCNEPQIMIASNKSIEEKRKSTSGGVFIELASSVIHAGGGIVYGAKYTDDWKVEHGRADTIEELSKFQGSKYLQSSIFKCFANVLSDLKAGLTVLFSGTPCQVAAIKSFVTSKGKMPGKLITVEILCYGVPSPGLFQEHIKFVERKYPNETVKKYTFRDERNGWGQSYIHSVQFDDGTELYNNIILQSYASLFSKGMLIRESCFKCVFVGKQRCADITIGDCWGIEHIEPKAYDESGVSQVWVNTDNGRKLWEEVKHRFTLNPCRYETLAPYNSALVRPAEWPAEYDVFWEKFQKYGYEYVLKHFTKYGMGYKIHRGIQKVCEKIGIKK